MKLYKSLLIAGSFLIITSAQMASALGREFTQWDYRDLIRDTGVEFQVKPKARNVLNLTGGGCHEAALASLAHRIFDVASFHGEDYPEVIEVQNAVYENDTGVLTIVSSGDLYQIKLGARGRNCTARVLRVSDSG